MRAGSPIFKVPINTRIDTGSLISISRSIDDSVRATPPLGPGDTARTFFQRAKTALNNRINENRTCTYEEIFSKLEGRIDKLLA